MKTHENKRIKDLMKKKKISQYDLSVMLGVSEMTVFRMLRRKLTDEEKNKILKLIKEEK